MTVHTRHVWIKPFLRFLKEAEDDAAVQIKIHKIAVRFWLVNFAVAVAAYIFLPDVWKQASVLYLVLVSLYANLATDYGALSASQSAYSAGKAAEQALKEVPDEEGTGAA